MAIYRFPLESDGEEQQNRSDIKFEGKAPDFIYIDEERPAGEGSSSAQGPFHGKKPFDFKGLGKTKHLGILRAISLIVALALTVWIGILSIVLAFAGIAAALLLFKDPGTKKFAKGTWKLICRFCAFALAFYVAIFSPAFGFSIIALYAMQRGENWQAGTFGRMFSSRFG